MASSKQTHDKYENRSRKNLINVQFKETKKKLAYPTTTVQEFIKKLRQLFKIPIDVVLTLVDTDESELDESLTLMDLDIEHGALLNLKTDEIDKKEELSITVHSIEGEAYKFNLAKSATLKELYKSLEKKLDLTKNHLLLFNHRMHIFKTEKILGEPLHEFCQLTEIENFDIHRFFNESANDHSGLIGLKNSSESYRNLQELAKKSIPTFYIFLGDLQYETQSYEYNKNYDDLLKIDDLWQPRSAKQTNHALSIFLINIYALIRVFSSKKETDFDSFHDVYSPQFLIVLRRYLFPPACLAFKHVLEGALFNFEKQLLSEAFYQMCRLLLPTTIPDNQLFCYTSYIFCWIFQQADHTSNRSTCYEVIDFQYNEREAISSTNSSNSSSVAHKYFVNPVQILSNEVAAGATDRVIMMEYEAAKRHNIKPTHFQRQVDVSGLLKIIRMYENNHQESEKDIFEKYSIQYTIWIPNSISNLYPMSNVYEQRRNLQEKKFTAQYLEELKKILASQDLHSIFTFANPTMLSKHNHAQLVQLRDDTICYLLGTEKQGSYNYICFDPSSRRKIFDSDDFGTVEMLNTIPGVVIRENAMDIRKIEQITFILFDISGSMYMEVGEENNRQSLLDLSLIAFNSWRDRLVSYKLPHAIGLIYFGVDEESDGSSRRQNNRFWSREALLSARVVEKCPITRNFVDFEKALENRPPCGFDTPLYFAIKRAINRIQFFRNVSASRLSTTCKNLILCLTDGVDNCSKILPNDILEMLLNNDIVFDTVSFDPKLNEALVDFCTKTKSYYYKNIPLNKQGILSLFESEAALSVENRDETFYGEVEKPKLRLPKDIHKPATSLEEARISDGRHSNVTLARIFHELNHLKSKKLRNFQFFITTENFTFWKVIMHGETGTPYANGRWLLFIQFPVNYPAQPPEIRFFTKIYHCNINDDGKICHDILTTAWSQKTSMHSIFMELLRLLKEPNADDGLSAVKSEQYKQSKEDYENTAIEWKVKYASATAEELKAAHCLQ